MCSSSETTNTDSADRKSLPQFEIVNRYAVLQVQTEEDNRSEECTSKDFSLAQTLLSGLYDTDKVKGAFVLVA